MCLCLYVFVYVFVFVYVYVFFYRDIYVFDGLEWVKWGGGTGVLTLISTFFWGKGGRGEGDICLVLECFINDGSYGVVISSRWVS